MTEARERFDYQDAKDTVTFLDEKLREQGLDISKVKGGIIAGSGLGAVEDQVEGFGDRKDQKVRIPFGDVHTALHIPTHKGEVQGHARQLVFGPLKGTDGSRLVMVQSGREHIYENVSAKQAVFWIRVMQLLGVETLIGSNAAGIVTPQTLSTKDLMLIHSDIDLTNDNPLVGINDDRFGPRFPHMGDHYPRSSRELVKKVAKKMGIELKEGTYIREKGPNYESKEEVFRLRAMVRAMWKEGRKEELGIIFNYLASTMPESIRRFVFDDEHNDFIGNPTATVGMSTTYEVMVAQQARQSKEHPAFKNTLFISTATNYAAGLGPKGSEGNPNHSEVKDNSKQVEVEMGNLVRGVFREIDQEEQASPLSLAA